MKPGALLIRLFSSWLYETSPLELPIYLGSVLIMGVTALGDSIFPARRASRGDPIETLRE